MTQPVDFPFSVGAALGGISGAEGLFGIFIARNDRDDRPMPIKQYELWCDLALKLLGRINGGATMFPPGNGFWINKAKGLEIVETSTLIYSFIIVPQDFVNSLPLIADFIRDYGRSTDQDRVGYIINNGFFTVDPLKL